ncbi:hypothetical protein ACF0H5_005053 [Mactra antiquata]
MRTVISVMCVLLLVTQVSCQMFRYPLMSMFPSSSFSTSIRSSFVPLSSLAPSFETVQPSRQAPIQDFFAGHGGRNGLPVWGGAGIGERHSNGLDRSGRGFYPLPIN